MAEPSRLALPELDLFRGLAAVLMIVNHAGFQLWNHAEAFGPLASSVLLLSSAAPALFFFATGLGVGLRPTCDRHTLADTALKAALLLLADQVVFWRSGAMGGLDFFSFIAGSMLIVTLLRLTRHPGRWATTAAIAVLALRFGLGPALSAHLPPTGLLAALFGVRGQAGVSYPVSPWLVYPLMGLVVGIAYRTHVPSTASTQTGASTHALSQLRSSPFAIAVAVTLLGGLGTAALTLSGAVFFRWGSMSAAYFVLTVALLGLGWAISVSVSRLAPSAARALSVRGVAAFLIVPFHYGLIELLRLNGVAEVLTAGFAVVLMLLIALSVLMSRWCEMWVLRLAGLSSPWVPALAGLAASVCLAVVLLLSDARSGWTFMAATCFQVLVAFWLARRLSPTLPLRTPISPRGAA
jgi:hypothetical protein